MFFLRPGHIPSILCRAPHRTSSVCGAAGLLRASLVPRTEGAQSPHVGGGACASTEGTERESEKYYTYPHTEGGVQPASPHASPPPGRAPRPGHRRRGRRRAPAPTLHALRPPPSCVLPSSGGSPGLGPSAGPAARAPRRAHRGARAPRSPLFLDWQPGAVPGWGCRSSGAPADCTAACCQARRARGSIASAALQERSATQLVPKELAGRLGRGQLKCLNTFVCYPAAGIANWGGRWAVEGGMTADAGRKACSRPSALLIIQCPQR